MRRRDVGWLLLLGSPGVAAGLVLTVVLPGFAGGMPWPARFDLVAWAVAAIASAVGGYLAFSGTRRPVLRLVASFAGIIFGAVMFAVAMIAADYFSGAF